MQALTKTAAKKIVLIGIMISFLAATSVAQKHFTKNGSISFFSKTAIENISADNNQVVSVLNTQNGEIQFSLLIKNFHFKKALMEEHFNENYLESDKFPKAVFKGTITELAKINFTADGSYGASVSGDLTIHGVTKKTLASGTITVKGGKIEALSRFNVKPSDFNIVIPKLVSDNIAETIAITMSCHYNPM